MANRLYISLLITVIVMVQSAQASNPLDFPEACQENPLGHKLKSDTCRGCICTKSNRYFCQNCVRITELPDSLERQGCVIKQVSGTNFPDCCPKVDCPEGVHNFFIVTNEFPKLEKLAEKPQNADNKQEKESQTSGNKPDENKKVPENIIKNPVSSKTKDRFVNPPNEVCSKKGVGAVIKSKRCEGCICSSSNPLFSSWKCRGCTTFENVPFSLQLQGCIKVQLEDDDFPDCCPRISCPDGVKNWFEITNSWPKV